MLTTYPHKAHCLMRGRHPSNDDVNKSIKSTHVSAMKDNYIVLCGHKMSQSYLIWGGGLREGLLSEKVIIELRFKETVGIN